MDRVVIGVRRQGQASETDIEVPTDLGASELAERLAKAVGEPGGDGPLELRAVGLGRALRLEETLADAGLWDGAILVLARSSDPLELASRGSGAALAVANAPSKQLAVIPIPDPPELGLAIYEPPSRPILPLLLAAIVALAVLAAGGVWFVRGRQEGPPAVAPAPTSVPSDALQVPQAVPTEAPPNPVVSNPTTVATQPQAAAADEDAAWRALLGQLDSVWGTDWPASIALLQQFHAQYPTRTAATDKLYSALVEYGRALRDAGATSAASDAFDQAVRLQPQRFEARDELASMAPAPTAVPETPTLPPPQPTPTTRPLQVAAPPQPTPPPRPPAEEPGVTCDVSNRDVACPMSDGARFDNSIAVPGGRHFYWFGVTSPGMQVHVETSGDACTCALYLFSDEVDSGNTPITSATGTLDLGLNQPGPYLLEIVPDQNGGPSDQRYTLSFALNEPPAVEPVAEEPAMQAAPTEAPVMVSVPPVVGHSTSDAADRVRAAGLVPQFQTAHLYSPSGPGTVAAQDPPAGSGVVMGGTVTLLVASGDVAVPAVVGLAEQDASTMLRQAGFDVGLRRARRSNVAAGQASSTDPPAGAIVPAGTTVTLTISQGP